MNACMQLLPHERMSIVESWWESLSDAQRTELLSVDLSDLRLRAAKIADKAKKRAGETPVNINLPNTAMYIPYKSCAWKSPWRC